MTAEEMFKQYGFKIIKDDELSKEYSSKINKNSYYKLVSFYKEEKIFVVQDVFELFNSSYAGAITFKLLKAINKQIKELGW